MEGYCFKVLLDFKAAKHGSATRVPSSVLSRGAAWLGIGILMDGMWGTGTGSTASVYKINLTKEVVDDFAEGLNERIRSTVREFLSTVDRLQAEQQKQVQEFHVLHIFYAGMCSLLLLAVGADVRAYGTQLCSQVRSLRESIVDDSCGVFFDLCLLSELRYDLNTCTLLSIFADSTNTMIFRDNGPPTNGRNACVEEEPKGDVGR
ncbi:nucleobase-ascorbate transporter 4-like protein [Tanacetum coccineum]